LSPFLSPGLRELKQAFRDGVDIHALTASQVFGVPLAAMDANTRRRAKAINFGIIYGIRDQRLASSADRSVASRGVSLYPRLF
jgi:DNA polymerase I